MQDKLDGFKEGKLTWMSRTIMILTPALFYATEFRIISMIDPVLKWKRKAIWTK
jgi:hypothetical protein